MSTSELYHMQGIKGYSQVGAVRYEGNKVIYMIEPQERLIRCPICGSPHINRRGEVTRQLRGVPIVNTKNVFFDVTIPRVYCPKCRVVRQIALQIAHPNRGYTKAFERAVITHATKMCISDVAEVFGVDWHCVNNILQDYLKKKYTSSSLKGIRRIAIDETSFSKGHKYITVVLNLDTGDPVYVGEGKSEEALQRFWELLGKRKKRIEVVAIDMGTPFQKAVRENLPNAHIVFDRFHVVKLMNTRLDELRRAVFASASQAEKNILRGSKYLLLKNECNLDPDRKEKERLDRALQLNTPLTQAYMLKESLRQIWEKDSYPEARDSLKGWIATAMATGVRALETMAKTLERYTEGILNYFCHKVTSGPIEGLNNKIKVMIRRAYGYRNLENFKRLVMGINEFDPRKLLARGYG